jgi:hypothetical protein
MNSTLLVHKIQKGRVKRRVGAEPEGLVGIEREGTSPSADYAREFRVLSFGIRVEL